MSLGRNGGNPGDGDRRLPAADRPAAQCDQRQFASLHRRAHLQRQRRQWLLFGSTKDLSCVYLTKDGVSQAYDGKIRRFGIDVGYTKAGHMVWHVYQLGGLVGATTSVNPRVLAGNYAGEQASVAANSSAGGNWLYGGSNNQIVLQATQIQDSRNAGYNLAYGIAEMSLSIGN